MNETTIRITVLLALLAPGLTARADDGERVSHWNDGRSGQHGTALRIDGDARRGDALPRSGGLARFGPGIDPAEARPPIIDGPPDGGFDDRMQHEVRFPAPDAEAIVAMPAAVDPGAATWRYVTTAPPPTWIEPTFDDASWSVGNAGFGAFCCLDPLDVVTTPWSTPQIWLRRTFELDDPERDVRLWGRWDDSIQVFINGRLAFSDGQWTATYRYAPISDDARAALVEGTNVLAVRVTDFGGAAYFDLGVADNPMVNAPATGWEVNPALAPIGELARSFFVDGVIPAGTVAVMKGDRLVVSRGHGWLDKHRTVPTPPNAILRLASLDKTPGAAAARRLVEDGFVDPVTGTTLTLDTPVFPLLIARGLEPLDGFTPDPRVMDVTIRHLIEHRSGMSELWGPAEMLDAAGVPIEDYTSEQNVRFVYGRPLAFDPGEGDQYCSACSMVLRHLVGELTGGFETYLETVVLDGYADEGMFVAHEPLELRSPRKPWYATGEYPYDRDIYLDHYYALASSAPTYARFCRGYNLGSGHHQIDPATGEWMAVPDNGATWFGGAMAGTRTFAIQRRWDEVTIVVLSSANVAVDDLAIQINDLVDALPADAWEPSCLADLDGDAEVDIEDLLALLSGWGGAGTGAHLAAPDDVIDVADLVALLAAWASCD